MNTVLNRYNITENLLSARSIGDFLIEHEIGYKLSTRLNSHKNGRAEATFTVNISNEDALFLKLHFADITVQQVA